MRARLSFFLLGIFASACQSDSLPSVTVLGEIPIPSDNPQNKEKIAFGKKLFFDTRLSKDNSISCATCHKPELAFTDGLPKSAGINGHIAMRNAPSLLNSAYFKRYMFDGEVKTLELQVLVPIADTNEMGSSMREVVEKLSKDTWYQQQAQKVFNRQLDPFVITRALSAYQRSILSVNSRFDAFYQGDTTALSSSERRGWKLFSEKLYCSKCHPAPHFTTYLNANNGLYRDYVTDQGRYRISGLEQERGFFKIPSLRNSAITAPYMHDGSIKTLREVLLHYASGGKKHPNQSKQIQPFRLSNRELDDLEHFLESLTEQKDD